MIWRKYYTDRRWVIETKHGVYPLGTWGYMSTRKTKAEAVARAKQLGPDYRVWDNHLNQVCWPHKPRKNDE